MTFGGTQAEGNILPKMPMMQWSWASRHLLKQTDIDFTVDSAEQVRKCTEVKGLA